MSDQKHFLSVPLESADNHPIAVHTGPNPSMGAWDIQIMIGNFKDKAAAARAADKLVKLMQREIGASTNELQ